MFVLLLIKGFGSTNAEIVKSCRKVMSIILSFVLYSKPVRPMHVVGFVIFIGSIIMTVKIKASKKKTVKAVPTSEEEEAMEPLKSSPSD